MTIIDNNKQGGKKNGRYKKGVIHNRRQGC